MILALLARFTYQAVIEWHAFYASIACIDYKSIISRFVFNCNKKTMAEKAMA
jgi:hypothetical protein